MNNDNTPRKQAAADRIAAELITMLEKGVIPWRQTWASANRRPVNQAGRPYRGINYFMIKLLGHSPNNVYMSFNNAKKLGGEVRKGEHGISVVFASEWTPDGKGKGRAENDQDEDSDEEEDRRRVFFWKGYTVFGVNQIDGLPERFYKIDGEGEGAAPDPIAAADEVIGGYEGAPDINIDGVDPCYDIEADAVHMPAPEAFKTTPDFYAALFHELSHSTGHESRLHRKMKGHNTDGEAYGHEELIAELSAAILLDHCGIKAPEITENNAAYCENWAKALKEQPGRAIVTAAAQASRAAEWILGTRRE